jgi:alpha-L-fucosidase
LTEKPEPGKAGIEAFFTTKGKDLFAILPHWSGGSLLLKDITGAKSVSLLGSTIPLKFKASKMGVSVELPDLPEELRSQPAWVLKISR